MGKNKGKRRFLTDVSKRRSELDKVDNYLKERANAEKEAKRGKDRKS